MKYLLLSWVQSSHKKLFRACYRFFLFTFIILFHSFIIGSAGVNSQQNTLGPQPLYIVKQVVETTSDWTTVEWIQGPDVIVVRHRILEGTDAPGFTYHVSGLSLWIGKSSYDTTKVVIEVEALALEEDITAQVNVTKGHIESTRVEFYAYNVIGTNFVKFGDFLNKGIVPIIFELDLSTLYNMQSATANVQKAIQEMDKEVYAFYYPWYAVPEGPTGWSFHWGNAFTNSPLMGFYDSGDENVIHAHMAMAKHAGIDGFITSWWGINSFEDKNMAKILTVAEQVGLQISIYYETVRDLTQQDIVDELTYVINSYADNPAFLKDSGRPVVFAYAIPYADRDSNFWLEVRRGIENNVGPIILIGDTFDPKYLQAFDGFHQYIYLGEKVEEFYGNAIGELKMGLDSMEVDEAFSLAYSNGEVVVDLKSFFLTVVPGYDDHNVRSPSTVLGRQGGEVYTRYWETGIELDTDSVLITSWNEWHEGTDIEPSNEYGFHYLNMTRQFVEEYKQVTLPSPESSFSATVNPFEVYTDNKGKGNIMLMTATDVPALYTTVQIKALKGAFNPNLQGDFYTYLKEQNETDASIMVPCAQPLSELVVGVNFNVDMTDVLLYINITANDPLGIIHELLSGYINVFDAGSWNELTHYVTTLSNSTVSDFNFNENEHILSFSVNGPEDTTGFCKVIIPKQLLWCDDLGQWEVWVDNILIDDLEVSEDANHAYIYFAYDQSTHEVQIKGIQAIPEYHALIPTLLFFILITFSMRARKRA